MKRLITVAMLVIVSAAVFAGPQFRLAGDAFTPIDSLPTTSSQWDTVLMPTEDTLSGWHWEVVFDRLGLGMHYTMRISASDTVAPYMIDWKGDFFLSYHLFGGGSLIDPFVEIGWGNAGSAGISSPQDAEYPAWEEKARDGSATALALFTYSAAGVALDLNGLLLGVRLAYSPPEMVTPIPDPAIDLYDLSRFEIGLFGGVALGSHNQHRHR